MAISPRFCGEWLLACAALFCFAVPACAQSIVIPDLRQRANVVPAPRAGEPCERCGVIRSIREIETQRPMPTQTQARPEVGGGLGSNVLVGAVIVLPTGSSGTSYVGGVGTPEMQSRFSETTYEITVRFNDGSYGRVERRDGGSFRVGDRVRLQGMDLELLAP